MRVTVITDKPAPKPHKCVNVECTNMEGQGTFATVRFTSPDHKAVVLRVCAPCADSIDAATGWGADRQ